MLPHTQLNHSDPETSLPPQPPTPPPPPWTPANPSLVSGLWAQSPALTWTHQRSPSPLPGATGLRGLLPQAFASLDGRALTFPQSSHPLLPLLSPWPWPTTDGTSHPLGNCSVTLQDPPSSPTQDTSPGGQSTLSLAFHLVSRVPTQRVTQGALGDRRLNVKIHGEGLHLQDTLIHEEGHSATRQALLSRVKPLPQLSPRQRKERGGKGAGLRSAPPPPTPRGGQSLHPSLGCREVPETHPTHEEGSWSLFTFHRVWCLAVCVNHPPEQKAAKKMRCVPSVLKWGGVSRFLVEPQPLRPTRLAPASHGSGPVNHQPCSPTNK